MSGWDNAPEYGGGGHWFTTVLAVVTFVAICAALVYGALTSVQ